LFFVHPVILAMSKIPNDVLEQAVTDIVRYAKETKKRRFVETVELQVGLKNYDVAKDKRFSGTIRLPKVCKPRMKFCVLGDVLHCDEAAVLKVDSRDMDALNQFKRDKKLVKKLGLFPSPLALLLLFSFSCSSVAVYLASGGLGEWIRRK
jgi:ribosomal protein L1